MPEVALIDNYDLLLRTAWAEKMPPTGVVRIGGAPTCKSLRLWLEKHRPELLLIDPANSWTDASFNVTHHLTCTASALGESAKGIDGKSNWGTLWRQADEAAAEAVDVLLAREPLTEATVVRQVGHSLPGVTTLFASNSMPVRDVESFVRAHEDPLPTYANRGASGIDGVISTAAGVASVSGSGTTLLIGDLAFRHDIGGFLAMADDPPEDLTIVLMDNGGGTIFSFLPAKGVVDAEQFERLQITPPTNGTIGLARALCMHLGIEFHQITNIEQLADLLTEWDDNPLRLLAVSIDAEANLDQHRRLVVAVDDAVANLP